MNVKLLRKVKRHILAEPKRLYMPSYVMSREHGDDLDRPFAKCGTAACIAGWACLLVEKSREPIERGDEHLIAGKVLRLTDEQADRLFLPGHWPEEFVDGVSGDGRKKTAVIAAARIEHFIKTRGRE